MSTNEEIREYAKGLDIPDELPRDTTFRVMAARPTSSSEPVTGEINGLYHAIYAMNRIEDEKGYAGVTFHLKQVDD